MLRNREEKMVAWRRGIIVAAIGMAAAGGCASQPNSAGQAQLELARHYFEEEDYGRAEEVLSSFLNSYGGTTEAATAFYLRGLARRRKGSEHDAAALADFKEAIKKAPKAKTRGLARAAVGHTLFENETERDYREAIILYKEALTELPDTKPKDAVLYRLGAALQNVGLWAQADLYLSRCLNDFADSEMAGPARRRFGARTFRLQVGAFADLNNAVRNIAELRQAGWKADWTAVRQDGAVMYAVRVGQYETYAVAQAGLGKLPVEPGGAIIVPTEPPKYSDSRVWTDE